MDIHENDKFDIKKEFLPIISTSSYGSKIRALRAMNNVTSKDLCKEIRISTTTLMHVEQNKIKKPYYYWKVICGHFNINHIEYLELFNMKENNHKDKLIKLRAYLGARTWLEVSAHLGYSEAFITDLLTRYAPNAEHLNKINSALEKLY